MLRQAWCDERCVTRGSACHYRHSCTALQSRFWSGLVREPGPCPRWSSQVLSSQKKKPIIMGYQLVLDKVRPMETSDVMCDAHVRFDHFQENSNWVSRRENLNIAPKLRRPNYERCTKLRIGISHVWYWVTNHSCSITPPFTSKKSVCTNSDGDSCRFCRTH